MEFTTEMGRIAQEIRRAAEERAGRLGRIRADARQLLSGARANLLQLASDRRQSAAEMANALRKSRKAALLLQNARRRLAAKEGKTRREVLRIRTQTGRFLKEAGRRHEEQGDKTKDGLLHFVAGLHDGVNGLLQHSDHTLQEFAADFRRGGRLFRRTLRRATRPAEQREEEKPAAAKTEHPPAHGASRTVAARPRAERGAHR